MTTLSWDAYNEVSDLVKAAERYKERYGYFPERILADKIFRTRRNLQYCKAHGIRLNGRPLGRPPKDKALDDEHRRLEREESGERNAIEGKFGEGKRRFSLGRVMTKLQATSETQIHLVFGDEPSEDLKIFCLLFHRPIVRDIPATITDKCLLKG